eukprot:TRINITY_DN7120_c0_g1_i2.p1 TRINITY_DN7120_c0_g1~~TRINITY_DN7120_c0_g1_i2.p1  ORF type:complete len:379 (+),score=61.61 TRINITY_DN7120_c0_g1_i2:72-1208(+)
MRGFFIDSVPSLENSLNQFQECIHWLLLDTREAVQDSIDLHMLSSPWFLTLFSSRASLTLTQRIWDVFFNEGFTIILRLSLALLLRAEGLLLSEDIQKAVDRIQEEPFVASPDILLTQAFETPLNVLMLRLYTKKELEEIIKSGAQLRTIDENMLASATGIFKTDTEEETAAFKAFASRFQLDLSSLLNSSARKKGTSANSSSTCTPTGSPKKLSPFGSSTSPPPSPLSQISSRNSSPHTLSSPPFRPTKPAREEVKSSHVSRTPRTKPEPRTTSQRKFNTLPYLPPSKLAKSSESGPNWQHPHHVLPNPVDSATRASTSPATINKVVSSDKTSPSLSPHSDKLSIPLLSLPPSSPTTPYNNKTRTKHKNKTDSDSKI